MKRLNKIPLLLLLVFGWSACEKEAALLPSDSKIESRYDFPQGDHAWDQIAVEIQEKFGVYLIYKGFREGDFMRSWVGNEGIGSTTYFGYDANNDQAEFAVTFMKEHIFDFLDMSVLAKVLPLYWYLPYNFYSSSIFIPGFPPNVAPEDLYMDGLDFWVASFESEFIPGMWGGGSQNVRPETKEEFDKCRRLFLQNIFRRIIEKGNITVPAGFHDGIDYATAYAKGSDDEFRDDPDFYIRRGFPGTTSTISVTMWGLNSSYNVLSRNENFLMYLLMCIFYTQEEYEEMWPPEEFPLIHTKRKMLKDHMKNIYNVDLEAMAKGPQE